MNSLKIWGMFLLGMFVCACSDVDNGLPVDSNGNPTLSFNMTRSPQSIVDNTQVYMFHNPAWEFYKQVLGVTFNNNVLSMPAETGTWNIALVTAETSIASRIILPVNGEARTGKLWATQPVGGELPSIPELRTGYLAGQQVIANQLNYGNEEVMLYRNVALVKVVIDKTRGLDVNGTHKFELNNVPTTLNWAGGLYPDKDNPDTSSSPMKGTFTIKDKTGEPGVQDSDTLEFIIPAHKGTDFLGAHNDTTTNKLLVSIDLACLGNVRYEKANVEVPRVPRVNGVLVVRLSIVGQLEINAEVLDWTDVALNADLSQTQLFVDKPEVGLAYKDTVYVNTNASNFTVAKDPAATWITAVNKVGSNGVEIIADVNTYVDNSPRTSYITITANNVTKKIPVTQRPDRGTISFNKDRIVVSPATTTGNVDVTSVGGPWKILTTTTKGTASSMAGTAGTSAVTYTAASTLNDALYGTVYGDTMVVVKNTQTLDTDTLKLSNLYIFVDENELLINHQEHSDVEVGVYGGDQRSLNITAHPTWVYSPPDSYYDNTTDKLHLRTYEDPLKDERWGYLTLQHKDDPAYTKTVVLMQEIVVEIPPFDFYTVKFTWGASGDVDIKCGFYGNSGQYTFYDGSTAMVTASFDDTYVGYTSDQDPDNAKVGNTVYYNGNTLIQWGGDERDGKSGECFFFNAPLIDPAPYPGQYGVTASTPGLLPRKLNLTINAGWWSSGYLGRPITCIVAAYRGGTYSKVDQSYNFTGTLVYTEEKTYNVNERVSTYWQYFQFCTVEYDRKKHTAKVVWAP